MGDIFPRLRLREILIVLLVIAGGLTALFVNVRTSGHVKITGPEWHRLLKSGGSYSLSMPIHTSLAEARTIALQPFPHDTRTTFYSEGPFCVTQIVQSQKLASRYPPGAVDVEYQTIPKDPNALPYLDKKNVNTVLVTALDNPDDRPSC
jgi:hypothetical protein